MIGVSVVYPDYQYELTIHSPWNYLEREKNPPPSGMTSNNQPLDSLPSSFPLHLVYLSSQQLNSKKTAIESTSGKNALPQTVGVSGL
jgi:hypothetical protein